jgi:hypothetical protein
MPRSHMFVPDIHQGQHPGLMQQDSFPLWTISIGSH